MSTLSIFKAFLEILFPRYCINCKDALYHKEIHFCTLCRIQLPKTKLWEMKYNPLKKLLKGRCELNDAYSLLVFQQTGITQKLMHEIKYNRNKKLAQYLGMILAKHIEFKKENYDYLIPVPLHKKKLKQRGYNQAEEIAKGFNQLWGTEILKNHLVKIKNNVSQTTQSRIHKFKNVEDVYAWNGNSIQKNKSLLLIDDVCTTGATLESCILTLNKAGYTNISIATAAMVFML